MIKRDRWIYPIVIDSTNNEIVIEKTGLDRVRPIPEGVYYNYMGSIPGFPSILDAIASAALSADVTVAFDGSIPFDSYKFEGGGIRLETDTPVIWRTEHPSFSPLLARVLGLPPVDVGPFDVVHSPFTTYGAWLQPCYGASYKASNFTQTQFRGPGISSRTRLNQRWGSHRWRRFSYKFVPSGLIEPGRSDLEDYQGVARLALGDANNLWFDVWSSGLSTGVPILIAHDTDGVEIGVDAGAWESVQSTGAYIDDFSQTINERGELARVYDIDLLVQSIGGTYESF